MTLNDLLVLIKRSNQWSVALTKDSDDYIGDDNLEGVKELLATVEPSNFFTYRDGGNTCYIHSYFPVEEYYACILSWSYYDRDKDNMTDPTPARIFLTEKKATVTYNFERKFPPENEGV